MEESKESILQLEAKIDRVCTGIDVMKDKQDQMADDISKIKEAVYNPDEGIYARIRELETWKATSSRIIWIIMSSVLTLGVAFVMKNFP
jgi:hypothetical protein